MLQFLCISILFNVIVWSYPLQNSKPPYGGTIFLDPDIITPEDSSMFSSLSFVGRDKRTMYDRRVEGNIEVEAYLFDATYSDGHRAEVRVNPEFGSRQNSQEQAYKYAWTIGQLPAVLCKGIKHIAIHKGIKPFGGGYEGVLIHTGQSLNYEREGILEETLVHEASHTALDRVHARDAEWLKAQEQDGRFVSTYARDNSDREDIAESFLLYLAYDFRSDRISQELADTIQSVMPNRIKYFKNQEFDMSPIQ
jgi:hypothetical protein